MIDDSLVGQPFQLFGLGSNFVERIDFIHGGQHSPSKEHERLAKGGLADVAYDAEAISW